MIDKSENVFFGSYYRQQNVVNNMTFLLQIGHIPAKLPHCTCFQTAQVDIQGLTGSRLWNFSVFG
jgi:hypothetical protein